MEFVHVRFNRLSGTAVPLLGLREARYGYLPCVVLHSCEKPFSPSGRETLGSE